MKKISFKNPLAWGFIALLAHAPLLATPVNTLADQILRRSANVITGLSTGEREIIVAFSSSDEMYKVGQNLHREIARIALTNENVSYDVDLFLSNLTNEVFDIEALPSPRLKAIIRLTIATTENEYDSAQSIIMEALEAGIFTEQEASEVVLIACYSDTLNKWPHFLNAPEPEDETAYAVLAESIYNNGYVIGAAVPSTEVLV